MPITWHVHIIWRVPEDGELDDFPVSTAADQHGDPEQAAEWYTVHRAPGTPGGLITAWMDGRFARVWSTTSNYQLPAAWRQLTRRDIQP